MSVPGKQSGSVLILSLVVLLVLTLLGLSGMNTTIMQERMAGNVQEMNSAFQAAEAGLRDGEADVANNVVETTVFNEDCSGGFCEPSKTATEVWDDTTKVDWDDGTNTVQYGTNTGVDALPGVSTQPQYIIEKLQVVDRSSSIKTGFGGYSIADWYRITSVGVGENGQSRVMVQSTYRK